MARSLAHLSFLLLVVSTALAARDLPDAATKNNTVDEACNETRFPDLCARSLLTFPDSRTASPRRIAELSVLAALDAGRAAATFAHDALNGVSDDDDGLLGCLDSCSTDVEEAVAHLSALSREPTDARFLSVKAWLSATLAGTAAAYEAACKDAPSGEVRDATVVRSVEFDMMLRVALDLITEASASMPSESADMALPPSEQDAISPAYGGAAFGGASPYGAPSYGGGVRRGKPRAPAPSPFRGYAHRRPRPRSAPAPAPSPFAGGYGAGTMRAPAPAPFEGYGHRRPRPRPRAPAPLPSYDGTRRPRAPAPSPFGGYGSARRTRAPAPSPFGGYGHRRPLSPAPSVAYGARRPRGPAPSYGPARPPKPSMFASVIDTDETE